jgi:hypothetical protein
MPHKSVFLTQKVSRVHGDLIKIWSSRNGKFLTVPGALDYDGEVGWFEVETINGCVVSMRRVEDRMSTAVGFQASGAE